MRKASRKIRKYTPVLLALLAVVVFLTLSIFVMPTIQNLVETDTEVSRSVQDPADEWHARILSAVFLFWFFFVGATIGSFLNVVVYRMPLGKSVVLKPSHCPFCQSKIRPWHNVPLFGWLALNGRCASCRLPISARYPLVELICGAIFLILFLVELVSGGINLPFHRVEEQGLVRNVFDPNWDLISLLLFHLFLFCALLTGSLIHWDRQPIPARFWITSGLIGVLAVWCFPHLHVWSWTMPFSGEVVMGKMDDQGTVHALIGFGAGGLAGCLTGFGLLAWFIKQPSARSSQLAGLPISLGLCGAFFGWQTMLMIVLVSFGLRLTMQLVGRFERVGRRVPWFMLVSLAAFLVILVWRWIGMAIGSGPGLTAMMTHLGLLIATLVLARLVSWTGNSELN